MNANKILYANEILKGETILFGHGETGDIVTCQGAELRLYHSHGDDRYECVDTHIRDGLTPYDEISVSRARLEAAFWYEERQAQNVVDSGVAKLSASGIAESVSNQEALDETDDGQEEFDSLLVKHVKISEYEVQDMDRDMMQKLAGIAASRG